MAAASDKPENEIDPEVAVIRRHPWSRAQRVLAGATAAAILLGGLNALVQMVRLALGH